jgi:hypothetical protein
MEQCCLLLAGHALGCRIMRAQSSSRCLLPIVRAIVHSDNRSRRELHSQWRGREIALVCCTQGSAFGIFPDLKITHLIPRHRVSEDYIVRLVEGIKLSDLLLDYKWLNIIPASPRCVRVLLSVLKTILLHTSIDRRTRFASVRALAKANRIIDADLKKKSV